MLVVLIRSAAPTIEMSGQVAARPSVHVLGRWPSVKCVVPCIEWAAVAPVSPTASELRMCLQSCHQPACWCSAGAVAVHLQRHEGPAGTQLRHAGIGAAPAHGPDAAAVPAGQGPCPPCLLWLLLLLHPGSTPGSCRGASVPL